MLVSPTQRIGQDCPECTKPSQSLANLVANFHSQGVSTVRMFFVAIPSAKTICNRQRIPSQRSIRSFLFEIWWLKFGRVRIRIRMRNCIAATAVLQGLSSWARQEGPESARVHGGHEKDCLISTSRSPGHSLNQVLKFVVLFLVCEFCSVFAFLFADLWKTNLTGKEVTKKATSTVN